MYTLSSVYILNMHSFCQAFLNKAGRKKKKTKDLQLSNQTIALEHKVSLIASNSD